MPISRPTLQALSVEKDSAVWPRVWQTWFTEAWQATYAWRKTYFATLTHDFGNINAQTQATQTVTVAGAAVGDSVVVRPTTAVNGIIIDGTVTAANTVTVRAVNYSAAAVDPVSQVYRVTVLQQ